jgi:hypothetical protein
LRVDEKESMRAARYSHCESVSWAQITFTAYGVLQVLRTVTVSERLLSSTDPFRQLDGDAADAGRTGARAT